MAEDQGLMYLQCRRCVEEWKAGVPEAQGESPRSFARFSVSYTKRGFQVWCVRHEINVMHVDFQGQKHPADLTEAGDFGESQEGVSVH